MKTVLLVDDDPLQAHVRKSVLGRGFGHVERAADAAEAFILVEDPAFSQRLGLVVVGLDRPGMGNPAFVAELTSRLPSVPVLVLGFAREENAFHQAPQVRFLPRTTPSDQVLTVSRQMVEKHSPLVA